MVRICRRTQRADFAAGLRCTPMRIQSARYFFLALVVASAGIFSSQEAAVAPKPWSAQWITDASVPQRDETLLHFRKIIELSQVPAHFVVHVSADNQFVFYVNKKRVGSGPSRSDLAHWRYETYDIAGFLNSGQNILAATVWNFGTHSALAQMSDRIAFLVHGAGAVERVADTGPSWQVEQETGIQTLPPTVRGYYAAEPGERLDGSALDWEWNTGSYAGSSWTSAAQLSPAAERGSTDSHNNWQLVADPLPAMEYKELPGGRVVRATGIDQPTVFPEKAFTVPPHTQASVLIDNGVLTTAYPELEVDGG